MQVTHQMIAVLPCNDVAASEAFYARLGFQTKAVFEDYRILTDGQGAELHLNDAVAGWLIPGRNPFGLYLRAENVDELAAALGDLVLHPAREQPWGMYEFALSDPDETLVRVGWPVRRKGEPV